MSSPRVMTVGRSSSSPGARGLPASTAAPRADGRTAGFPPSVEEADGRSVATAWLRFMMFSLSCRFTSQALGSRRTRAASDQLGRVRQEPGASPHLRKRSGKSCRQKATLIAGPTTHYGVKPYRLFFRKRGDAAPHNTTTRAGVLTSVGSVRYSPHSRADAAVSVLQACGLIPHALVMSH